MRAIIIFFCTCTIGLLIPYKLQAQSFSGGAEAGMVTSQVAGDLSSGYNKIGFFATAYTERTLTLKSSLRLEISFAQKGSRESASESKKGLQYLLRTNFIEIPLLYIYKINDHIKLKGGLGYAYLIGTPHEEAYFAPTVINKDFHRSSLNFIIGVEYYLTKNISVGIDSNNSITPIRQHESGAKRLFNRGQYSDALQLGIGYHF